MRLSRRQVAWIRFRRLFIPQTTTRNLEARLGVAGFTTRIP